MLLKPTRPCRTAAAAVEPTAMTLPHDPRLDRGRCRRADGHRPADSSASRSSRRRGPEAEGHAASGRPCLVLRRPRRGRDALGEVQLAARNWSPTSTRTGVTVGGHGEAAISVYFTTWSPRSPSLAVPERRSTRRCSPKSPRDNFIDELVLKKLRTASACRRPARAPTPSSSAGRTSTRRHPADAGRGRAVPRRPRRRTSGPSSIDELLERPEFVDYWAYKWSDLLLVSSRKLPQPAMWAFYRFVRQSVADNKPWDRFARDILTATGSTLDNGGGNYLRAAQGREPT